MVISFVKREFGEWAVNPRSTKTGALSVTHFFTDTMMLSEKNRLSDREDDFSIRNCCFFVWSKACFGAALLPSRASSAGARMGRGDEAPSCRRHR
ncbi:MAG: hypothetical protein LBV61_09485, partial [Burkholderiaceae bacterium]|nr:hypothetical protein [Burkholderiaceae bacterium]